MQRYKTLRFVCQHHLPSAQGQLRTHELLLYGPEMLKSHREEDGCSVPCCPVSSAGESQGGQPRLYGWRERLL